MVTCCVESCDVTHRTNPDQYTFHKIPSKAALREKWLRIIGRPNWAPKANSSVCSKHFDRKYLIERQARTVLLKGALPTKFVRTDAWVPLRTADASEERYMSTDSEYHTDEEDNPSNVVRLFVDSFPVKCRAESAQQLVQDLRALRDRVARLVPELGTKRLALHFRDDNNDEVEYIFTSSTKDSRLSARHPNIECDECGRDVEGLRYKCVACPDCNLCGACEALGLHHQHALMKITKPLHTRKARQILKTWCDKMREEGGEERLWTTEEPPEDNVADRSEIKSKFIGTATSHGKTQEPLTDNSISQCMTDKDDDNMSKYTVIKVEPSHTEIESSPTTYTEAEVGANSMSDVPDDMDPLTTAYIKKEEPEEIVTSQEETLEMPVSPDLQYDNEEERAAGLIEPAMNPSTSQKPTIIHIVRNVAPKIEEGETPNKMPRTGVIASTSAVRPKLLQLHKRKIIMPLMSVMRPAASSGRSGPVRGVLSAGGSQPRGAALVSLPQGVTGTRLGRPAVPGAAGAGAGAPTSSRSAGSQRRQDDSQMGT